MAGTKIWELSNEFIREPESTHYVETENAIFVANIVGGELDKDGEGWISKVSPEGEIIEGKWVEGLNAPHGMRTYQGTLWVADIDELVGIDLESATVTARIPVPDSEFLNDLDIADDGTIFVSDTLTNEIYQVTQDGDVSTFAPGVEKEFPNGLLIQDNKLIVAAWGNIVDFNTFETDVPGNVFELDLNSGEKTIITTEPLGNLDGIELDEEGNFLVTDFYGKLYLVDPTKGEAEELLSDLEYSADIALITRQDLVIIPDFDRKVQAYQYKPDLGLREENTSLLELGGDTQTIKLEFNLSNKNLETGTAHEVGVFVVDDLEGRIDGLLPGDDSYIQAALSGGETIFSVISDDFIANPSRIIDGFDGQFLSFYLIQNGSTDEVLTNPDSESKVMLGTPLDTAGLSTLHIDGSNDNQFELNFEDNLGDDESDLVLTVESTDKSPLIGTQFQGQAERELINLLGFAGNEIQVSFPVVASEADFENTVGFYQVESLAGTVVDPITGQEYNPGEAGYTQAALRNSQELGISFNDSSENFSDVLSGGHLYAPFLIMNNTLESSLATLDADSNQEIAVYFSYIEANFDGVDHVRLLGDNTWGFEDLPQGGDMDFNDIVIQSSFG